MVRSSISDAERRAWNRVLGIGFVGVVGLSASIASLANGATLVVAAGLGVFGLLMGTVLVWYLSTLSMSADRPREHRER